ncbi:hypothetical protein E2C01_047911 [Portunus trituberculatus]|uniref:Uncharacterized protein n=1 Tax=Portunus trituberculatus TaxID=210409 RepID=A0A5B7G951_PORTR|nr:hypothetical protein [Portunus trituberculatus]
MIGLVTRLPLICHFSLPEFSWEVVDDSHGCGHLPIYISYARDILKFNYKGADWATFRGVADCNIHITRL